MICVYQCLGQIEPDLCFSICYSTPFGKETLNKLNVDYAIHHIDVCLRVPTKKWNNFIRSTTIYILVVYTSTEYSRVDITATAGYQAVSRVLQNIMTIKLNRLLELYP